MFWLILFSGLLSCFQVLWFFFRFHVVFQVMFFPQSLSVTQVTCFCSQLHIITNHLPTVYSFLVPLTHCRILTYPSCHSLCAITLLIKVSFLLFNHGHSFVFIVKYFDNRLCRAFCSGSLSFLEINPFWFLRSSASGSYLLCTKTWQ